VTWATHVDLATGRPVEDPNARYADETVVLRPSAAGGHNWHPMSFHPGTGLVYLPIFDVPFGYRFDPEFVHRPGLFNTGVDPVGGAESMVGGRSVGALVAWDPRAGREVWRVEHRHLANGGTLATAGNLVFQGTGSGRMRAYRATDGEALWETRAGTGIIAAPVTYQLGDAQYVAVMAGWGGAFALSGGDAALEAGTTNNAGRLLVYKRGGRAKLPVHETVERELAALPADFDPKQVERGNATYHQWCLVCHGAGAVGGGVLPDLRQSAPEIYSMLPEIVLRGAFEKNGMPRFDRWLDADDVEAIRAHLLSRRARLVEARAGDAP
jgi:quinohemoprotein ethanol dehydrogenase